MIKLSVELSDGCDARLHQPLFLEDARELGFAVKQAIDDFLEVHHGQLQFPLAMEVHAAPEDSSDRAEAAVAGYAGASLRR